MELRPGQMLRVSVAAAALAVAAAAVALPVDGRKSDQEATSDTGTVTDPVDPAADAVPTAVPPDPGAQGSAQGFPAMPTFPAMPGSGAPDEVGGIIDPARIAKLVQECASISVAGLSVAAHNCAGGIDVVGTLPPDAPWTVFVASKDSFVMAAPKASSGAKSAIELPYAAEQLRKWVFHETGVRLKRSR